MSARPDPPRPCTVAVVDRLPLDRQVLARALDQEPGFTVTGTAATLLEADGADGGNGADGGDGGDGRRRPDVVVVRAVVPGTDLRAEVAAANTLGGRPRVVVLAGYVDAYLVDQLSAAGADAVASPDLTLASLLDLLRGGAGARSAPVPPVDRRELGVRHHLTTREQEILDHLADGLAPGQIAHLLELRVSTIRDHVKSLRAKLGCTSATQVVITAHRLGLVPHVGRPLR